MDIEELRRELLGGLLVTERPACEHRRDDRLCGRPAEHECDSKGGLLPRFVCTGCLPYQWASVGRLVISAEVKSVRINGEGKIVGRRMRRRS